MGTTPTSRARFITPVRVRPADVDASGTVYHGTYLVYFEVARVEALRGLGVPLGEFERRGVLMPVVEARLTCSRRASVDDLLQVAVMLDRLGPASFSFDYEVARDDLVIATGWTRMAVMSRDTGRSMPLPAWVRGLLGGIAGQTPA